MLLLKALAPLFILLSGLSCSSTYPDPSRDISSEDHLSQKSLKNHLLSRFQEIQHLYKINPNLTDGNGPNCFNNVLFILNYLDYPRFVDSLEFYNFLHSPFCKKNMSATVGTGTIITYQSGIDLQHAAIAIDSRFLVQKVGPDLDQPYERKSILTAQKAYDKPRWCNNSKCFFTSIQSNYSCSLNDNSASDYSQVKKIWKTTQLQEGVVSQLSELQTLLEQTSQKYIVRDIILLLDYAKNREKEALFLRSIDRLIEFSLSSEDLIILSSVLMNHPLVTLPLWWPQIEAKFESLTSQAKFLMISLLARKTYTVEPVFPDRGGPFSSIKLLKNEKFAHALLSLLEKSQGTNIEYILLMAAIDLLTTVFGNYQKQDDRLQRCRECSFITERISKLDLLSHQDGRFLLDQVNSLVEKFPGHLPISFVKIISAKAKQLPQ